MLEKIQKLSLKWKIAGLLALAFLVMSAILLFSLNGFLNHKLEALYGDAEIKCRFLADLLVNDLNPIIENDIDSLELERTVKSYQAVYGIYGLRYIFILDESNSPIVDTFKDSVSQKWIDYNTLDGKDFAIKTYPSKDGEKNYYDCALPFALAGKSQGTMRVGLWEGVSSLPVHQTLKNRHSKDVSRPLLLMALLLTIVLTALLTTAFWYFMIRRIESVSQATERMSFGDLETEVDINSQDELGVLEDTLERMRANLKDAIERLKRRK
jgi:methyl-accepting chemotaxis protein